MKKSVLLLAAAILGIAAVGFSQNYIVETVSGVHVSDYTANGMSASSARVDTSLPIFSELTPSATRTQCAYCTLALLNKTPRITPSALTAGQYTIEYCWPNVASINATGVTYRVQLADATIVTGTTDCVVANANTWVALGGTATYQLGSGSYVEFDTSTANGGTVDSTKRFYIDAVRFVPAASGINDWALY